MEKISPVIWLLAAVVIVTKAQDHAAPMITFAPKSMKVAENMIVSFFCKASGYPPPDFHWEKDGKTINTLHKKRYHIFSMPHGTVLRIQPAKAKKDNTYFTCVAGNEHGEARANATLKIYEVEEGHNPDWKLVYKDDLQGYPRITQNPSLKNVEKEQTATLVCSARAENREQPAIYWLKDNLPLETGDPRIKVDSDGTLSIERTQERDHGKYECVAENNVGVAYSSAAMLYVKIRRVPPHFSIEPPDVLEVEPNASVTIDCVAVGSPMPVVKWRKGYQEVNKDEDPPHGKNVLNLTGVRESANYTCIAQSELGNIEKDVQIKVKALPNPPVKLTASEITPSSLKLSWKPGNQDDISYVVQYKAKSSPGDFIEIKSVKNTEYMIEKMNAFQHYQLRAIAVTKSGRSPPSAVIEVVTGELVLPPVDRVTYTYPRHQLAPGSAPRNVRARPHSLQTIRIDWDEPEIPNGIIQGYKVFYTTNPDLPIVLWMNQEVAGENKMTTISGLIPNSTYTICVLAFSSMGQGPLSVPVQVMTRQGVPLQPRNLRASARGPNEIEVTWDAPEDVKQIIDYTLYYNDSQKHTNGQVKILPPTTKYILTELVPDTIYHIQLAARSGRGLGARTILVQAKTPEFTPAAPPQAVSGRPVGHQTILVEWRPPPAEQQNGIILGYRVFYLRTEDGLSDNEADHVEVTKLEATLAKLDIWTEYKIWVLAFTAAGDSPQSPPIFVKTHESVPNEPKRVQVQAVNSTTIYVEWRPPRSKERNGMIRGYYIYYNQVDDNEPIPGTEKVEDVNDGNKNEAVITGLLPDTRYQVTVAGYTRRGDGVRSRPKIISTMGAVPSAPRKLTAQLVKNDPASAQITWWKPEFPNGNIKGYKLYWGPKGQVYEQLILKENIHTWFTPPLDRGVLYEFRVLARNEIDYGERAVAELVTPDGVPQGAPQNFSAVGLTETSVRLAWDLPANKLRNGEIVSYQLIYYQLADSINVEEQNISGTQYDVTGLEMNTDYVFQIKAYTVKGAGPWSPRLQYRTFGKQPPPPEKVRLYRTSPTTIIVRWEEPKRNNIIAAYRIYYFKHELEDMSVWDKIVTDGPTTTALLTDLDQHQSYAVRVQSKSVNDRWSNLTNVIVTNFLPLERDDTVQNYRPMSVGSRQVTLSWEKPRKTDVTQYVIEYQGQKTYHNTNGVETSESPKSKKEIPGTQDNIVIKDLQPRMVYSFNITAYFQDGNAGKTQFLECQTKIEAPAFVATPKIVSVGGGRMTIGLQPASEINGHLAYYDLAVVQEDYAIKRPQDFTLLELTSDTMPVDLQASKPYIAARFDPRRLPGHFELGNKRTEGTFHNRLLDSDRKYRVFLRAYTVTGLYKSSDYSDSFTVVSVPHEKPVDPRYAVVEDNKAKANSDPQHKTPSDEHLVTIIIVCACAGVVLIVIGCAVFALIMRRKTTRKEKAPEPASKLIVDNIPPHPTDPVELRRQHYQTPAMISHPPIPIHMLAEHIESLKSADNLKFSQEYESIEPGQQFTWDNSNLEYNKPKNRYANVIAYDHSRVILQPIDSISGSDYINANYMDGYRKQNAYIATQGPLPETFGDFWRMVWEQRCATIVMMTKLEERSRIKCDQYWPGRGAETYGLMHVLLVDVAELATYTIRTFHIQRYGVPEKREVRQFQFTAWPDHGVPDHPTPLLMFMRRVKATNPPDAGPVICHCSAGVGRTGAFIVIDAMLERIKHEKTVDIYGHVTCLRAQRNYMVQTEDQYIFIHDALLEAVTCGNTEVPARSLSPHIQKLMQPEPGETVTGMELEFKRLANMKASPNRFVSANLPVNKFKNRLVNILPYESTRVALQPIRGVDGSDYINASFINGYRYRRAYVATQGPLADTTEDFWRMLWEHNSTIIVMLTKLREMGREKCHQYWPSERSARYQYFVVDPMAEYNMPQYILREFKVTDARDGQSRTIRQFQFTDWPEQGVPKSGEGFIDFIGQVHKTKEQFGQEGPITVHCSAGVGRTGVFITLSIVLERMRYEGVVDMFQTVKMLRTQRPAMVQTEDQYQFCYRAALEYLGSFDHYAN
ncbi:tyrosine-protein phosphatase Lar-like isoform X6 [Ruditapes philippinarum]|uniref:tyrosine-protein phosphatase Lar-like isoform X6 n=1 Tax=Ruditapes philippinarum TaxID=129788 RepID=UPI00295B9607|nr:tyrosine-protein phosphatase Lar-like isoform X6 [Ruditapes philippinarum]XP_060552125.1 tyrosine-protein phosphatase Lar-like isoform X6 [Ruditapes philippinarum]XP_060552126.1 tyrosine-protein phosphatase Lar-like isoform X6 [Ruditapes philippinarum]